MVRYFCYCAFSAYYTTMLQFSTATLNLLDKAGYAVYYSVQIWLTKVESYFLWEDR